MATPHADFGLSARSFRGVSLLSDTAAKAVSRELDQAWGMEVKFARCPVSCGTLDPIDVGRSANVEQILAGAEPDDPAWWRLWCECMSRGFPRRPGVADSRVQSFAQHYLDAAQVLKDARIIRRARRDVADRDWVGYFQVPKTDSLDRAIVNCVSTNSRFADAPPIRLIEIDRLLFYMRLFGSGVAVATADIRHFFWQISLPKGDRRFFSIKAGLDVFEFAALPMGWSWAPWVAQGLASRVICKAAGALGLRVETGTDALSPPSHFELRTAEGELRAVVIAWYDDFLVLAPNDILAGKVCTAIDKVMARYQLQWKRDISSRQWTRSVGSGTYIGINFAFDEAGHFAWRHAEANPLEWAAVTIRRTMPVLQVAQVLGVLTWDATVRLKRLRGKYLRSLISLVGTTLFEHPEESWATLDFVMKADAQEELRLVWAATTRNLWKYAPLRTVAGVITLASDATLVSAAGLWLHPAPIRAWILAADLRALGTTGINEREALAAVMTVGRALDGDAATNRLYAIAIDNTTALAWFNGRGCPHAHIATHIADLEERLASRSSAAVGFWVSTDDMPADEPSRGRDVSVEKIGVCDVFLREQSRIYLGDNVVRGWERARRVRDDDAEDERC